MPKRVFYSFHYEPDNWRVSQVRNIGAIESSPVAHDNDWEQIKKGGDAAIQKWIDDQLSGRACTLVLIGAGTAGRRWIKYEIEKSWNDGKGVVGVYIHNLKDQNGQQSLKGSNPFSEFMLNNGAVAFDTIVKAYDPPYSRSADVYRYIAEGLEKWIDEAISIRTKHA